MRLNKRSTVAASLLATAFVAAAAATTLRAEPKLACEVAADWVEANRDNLPSTLTELSTHPMMYRRAIYAALPHDLRVDMWREHLSVALVTPAFNNEQRALIQESLDGLDRFLSPEGKAASDAFKVRVLESFTREEAIPVFVTLGPMEDLPSQVADESRTVSTVAESCNCEIGDNWCWTLPCSNNAGCTPGGSCGWLWLDPCTGTCSLVDET